MFACTFLPVGKGKIWPLHSKCISILFNGNIVRRQLRIQPDLWRLILSFGHLRNSLLAWGCKTDGFPSAFIIELAVSYSRNFLDPVEIVAKAL